MSGILLSIKSYLSSVGIIFKPRYIKYLLYSGLISVLFFGVALFGFWFLGDFVTNFITNLLPEGWIRNTLDVISNFAAFIGLAVMLLLLYKHIVLILVGPVMGTFSEKLERDRLGEEAMQVEPKFGAIYSTYRGVRIASRNIVKELFWTAILLLSSVFIPFLSVVTVPLIFLVQSYYAGFGNMDVSIGRHKDINASIQYVKQNKLMITANGAIFLGLLLIPILGAFLAPMLATSASTLSMLEKDGTVA